MQLASFLEEKFSEALLKAFQEHAEAIVPFLPAEVSPATQEEFGHYQCNVALKMAKPLRSNPRQIAEKIVEALGTVEEIEKLEVAGPGFINITLSSAFIARETEAIFSDPRLGVPPPERREKVIVEFSSPNVAKELHVGHLRSTIIGDALARLFEFLGHDVLRLNHIGDWGTQFGMLIAYIKEFEPSVIEGHDAELSELMRWYRAAKKHFDEDPSFKKRSQEEVVRLQGGDPESNRVWRRICEISRGAFEEIYKLLDIQIVERGESFYNPKLPEVVSDLEEHNILQESDGAKCVFLEGYQTQEKEPLPLIVVKSDGGYNYATTDLAALKHRIQVEKADRIILVVDYGQRLHFEMAFKAAQLAGYYDPQKVQVTHVGFGVVLGPDGKKFKTRSGETEKLIDLITKAIDHAEKMIEERLPDAAPHERKELAQILGIDAIKYADLSCHRAKDYLFSYERMLRFEGNTAAYLLYSYVRIQGIKRKVGKEIPKDTKLQLEHPSEVSLALHLRQFGESLEVMARDLLPNRLTDYLYTLAEKFHAFFRDCRVEGSEQEASRLLLCEITARILKQGLNILGLKTMDRM